MQYKRENRLNLNFINVLGVLLVLIFTGIVVVYIKDLRCLIINRSDKFTEIKLGTTRIYISNETPKDTIELILDLVKKSVDENEILWQEEIGEIVMIYCHSISLYDKYGASIANGITRLGKYSVISSKGLELDLLSHEFCHVILFNKLERSWWVYYQKLPSWFDEGLALQFNNRGVYSKESLSLIDEWGIEKLKKIDRPSSFYVDDYKLILNHYQVSKKEVLKWLEANGVEKLHELLARLKRGHDFYEIY